MSVSQLESKFLDVLLANAHREAPCATPFDGQWQKLDVESASHWLAKTAVNMARRGDERPALVRYKVVGVREFRPRFYDGVRAIECWVENREARYGTLSYLEHDGRLHLLNGSSATIHELNAAQQLSLTLENAADYLRFFVWHIWSDGGLFAIADHPRYLYWTDDASEELRRRVADRLLPLELHPTDAPMDEETKAFILRHFEELPKTFAANATMIYHGSLYRCSLNVAPTGMVKMADDDPLEDDLPVLRWNMSPHGALFLEPPTLFSSR